MDQYRGGYWIHRDGSVPKLRSHNWAQWALIIKCYLQTVNAWDIVAGVSQAAAADDGSGTDDWIHRRSIASQAIVQACSDQALMKIITEEDPHRM